MMSNDKKKPMPDPNPNRKPRVFPGEQPGLKPKERKPEGGAIDGGGASKGQPGQPPKKR
jgi:hypothetical protein